MPTQQYRVHGPSVVRRVHDTVSAEPLPLTPRFPPCFNRAILNINQRMEQNMSNLNFSMFIPPPPSWTDEEDCILHEEEPMAFAVQQTLFERDDLARIRHFASHLNDLFD